MQIEEVVKKNAKEVKAFVNSLSLEEYPFFIEAFSQGEKKYLRDLAVSMTKKVDAVKKEKERIKQLYAYEQNLKKNKRIENILCLDEVGRGPLAGPVAVCGVMIQENPEILYVNDSKKLSEAKRQDIYAQVIEKKIPFKVEILDNKRIDEINIFQATYEAMRKLVRSFEKKIDHILIDGNQIIKNIDIDQTCIVKGDSKVLGIALASIMAKVTRDAMMVEYDKIYPQYGFAKNKGYGTAEHVEALKKYGASSLHRQSFLHKIL